MTFPRQPPLFDGPGDIRGLCRSMDWAATPLGPVRTWSATLRSTLALCLDSGFPILLNWGSDLVAVYNDAFTPLIGGKHPEALGRPAKEVWPESWDAVGARLDEVLVRGRTLRFTDERQILERNGYPEECYFTFSHSPIRDVDGTIVGLFTASTETTAQVVGERRMRILREVGGVSTTDGNTIADACRSALQVLARTPETVPFAVAYLAEGEDTELRQIAAYGLADAGDAAGSVSTGAGAVAVTEVIGRVIRTGRAESVGDLRNRFPGAFAPGPIGPLTPDEAVAVPFTVSGRSRPIGAALFGVNPYRRLNEEFQEFFAMLARQIRDTLTDVVAYEAERHRVEVLADLDRAKTEFFQNVSHELRTPLTLLLGPLQDLLARQRRQPAAGLSPAEWDSVETAVRAGQRLRGLVGDLLKVSGAETGGVFPDRRAVDLAEVTVGVAGMFRSWAEHAGLRFDIAVPDEQLTALVDPAMWSTIVTNLLSNAVKYTQLGAVTLTLAADEDEVMLTITDTGSGIPLADRRRVFDRFYRVTTSEPQEGSGIGLALVAELVAAHGGHIGLTSRPGMGSTFTVIIPVGDVPAGHETFGPTSAQHADPDLDRFAEQDIVTSPPLDTAAAGQVTTADPSAPRLLLVEDDDDLRAYLTRLIAADGWAVQDVPDAETALSVVAGRPHLPPDLVVTDVMLPGRSGLQLVTELRAAPSTARLPVIVLTALGGNEAAIQGFAAGADDYITKPFQSPELLARIRANHRLHQLREQAIGDAEDRAEQIRGALDSSRVIGTAIGILMAVHRLNSTDAFQLLLAASQNSNRKLRSLAADVVQSGTLPFRPTETDALLLRIARPR